MATDQSIAALQKMLEDEIGPTERRSWLDRVLGRQQGTSEAARSSGRRGDITVAALGITLGLICALFPWYIFFNQDKFGIRAMRFSSDAAFATDKMTLTDQPERVGAPMKLEPPEMELDLFATGTLKDEDGDGLVKLPTAEEQPFPAPEPVFHVVHVTNGRAMMEDDSGLWVVERGSRLPDDSTVASIERRDGRWVVVTSENKVLQP